MSKFLRIGEKFRVRNGAFVIGDDCSCCDGVESYCSVCAEGSQFLSTGELTISGVDEYVRADTWATWPYGEPIKVPFTQGNADPNDDANYRGPSFGDFNGTHSEGWIEVSGDTWSGCSFGGRWYVSSPPDPDDPPYDVYIFTGTFEQVYIETDSPYHLGDGHAETFSFGDSNKVSLVVRIDLTFPQVSGVDDPPYTLRVWWGTTIESDVALNGLPDCSTIFPITLTSLDILAKENKHMYFNPFPPNNYYPLVVLNALQAELVIDAI